MTKTELLNFSYVLHDAGVFSDDESQEWYYANRDRPELLRMVPLPFLLTDEELHFLNEIAEELEVSLVRLLRTRLGLNLEPK